MWISIAPLDGGTVDPDGLALSLGEIALQVWFDEDCGVVLQFSGADGWGGELSLVLEDNDDSMSEADGRFLAELQEHGVLSQRRAETLRARMQSRGEARSAWVLSHGVEALLGLPFQGSLPVHLPDALLRELVPGAEVFEPRTEAKRAAVSPPREPLPLRAWTAEERAIVDLHFDYLTHFWSMNDWEMYRRYKKYLPASRRSEVDRLVDLMMRRGDDERVRTALEGILGSVWDAADWGAIIRDQAITESLPVAERGDWSRRLAGEGASGDHGEAVRGVSGMRCV